MRSGLCISNMVYLDQFVCLSDGVILKVVATSIAEIDRPVYHDVRNSMPHPMYYGYECSFIYHVYRGYSPFMYCMCMYVYVLDLIDWMQTMADFSE